jgi:hypothetical protein
VWTLNAGIGYSHAGGASSTRFKIEDTNILGTGKRLRLEHRSTVDRATTGLELSDPALLGSRARLDLGFDQSSDGDGWLANIEKPFYSLDDRWSAGLRASVTHQVDSLYRLGEPDTSFGHVVSRFELYAGASRGLRENRLTRWSTGVSYERDQFERREDTLAELPADRTFVYPWVAWDWQDAAYQTSTNIDLIGRTEDLVLGTQGRVRLGFAAGALGSERDALMAEGSLSHAREPTPSLLLRFDSSLSGRWELDGRARGVLHLAARSNWINFGDQQLFVGAFADLGSLDPEVQLTLGGDSGLRGYPLRYQ